MLRYRLDGRLSCCFFTTQLTWVVTMEERRFKGWWKVRPDGADFRCADCQELVPASRYFVTETKDGHRSGICSECIDDYWKQNHPCLGSL